ncbi:MAG: RDD family protein [Chloroflexi bacterium]|nr:MAG: RDD family protein [Chloroflexota bacterium]
MRVVTWDDDRVSTRAAVAAAGPFTGARLRDSYLDAVRALTFGLVTMRANSLVFGPLELLRFGPPRVTRDAVDWPIEGGLLAGRPGGHWRVEASSAQVEAILTGYRPRLPRLLYTLSHLQVHQLLFRAAAVDVAFCLTLARLSGRRRLRRTLAIAIAYHVGCWSISGRTLGGLVLRQRVVAVDGSRLTPTQSLLRLALLPAAWIDLLVRPARARPVHDELASTDVISD